MLVLDICTILLVQYLQKPILSFGVWVHYEWSFFRQSIHYTLSFISLLNALLLMILAVWIDFQLEVTLTGFCFLALACLLHACQLAPEQFIALIKRFF